ASDSGLVYRTTFQFLLAAAYMLAFAVLVRTREQVVATFVTLALGSLVFGLTAFAAYVTSSGSFFESNLGATGLQGDHVYFAVHQPRPDDLQLVELQRRPRLRAHRPVASRSPRLPRPPLVRARSRQLPGEGARFAPDHARREHRGLVRRAGACRPQRLSRGPD